MAERGRILVVDDDQSLCRLLKAQLSSNGYLVDAAHTGEKGLEMMRSFRPELVILDLLLPGIDGYVVCRRIREDPEFAGIHVLLLTAVYLSEEDIHAGFHIGADSYLVKPDLILSKPVHLKDLQAAVDAVFAGGVQPRKELPGQDKILVVDDDDRNRRLLKMRFASEGLEVLEAESGPIALEVIASFQPHLMLLDIKMPVMSGLDVLKEVRERGFEFPVVMMTAYGSESIAVEAFGLGADDYLIKPFDSTTAVRRIRRLVENFRLRRSSEQLTERLKKISCDLVNRVNHLEVQNQRLENAYARVRGLSEFNQRFIRSLSQELRAPLSTILSFASLLCDTPPDRKDPEREQEALAVIYRTAFRLEINLSNLIYLSRIQSDAMQVMPVSVPLEPVVEETLALARRTLGRGGIQIQWYPENEGHIVRGDRTILRDILVNLLDNAIRRTEGSGEIFVEVLEEGRRPEERASSPGPQPALNLRIRDTGSPFTQKDLVLSSLVGIDPESMKESSESVRLSLCRRLAEAAGWSASFTNRPMGGGETMIRMPSIV